MYDDVCVHSHRSPRSYFPGSSLGRTSVVARIELGQDLGVYQVLSGKGIKTVLFSLGARGLDHFLDPVPLQKNHDIPSGKHTKSYGKWPSYN